MRDDRFSHLDFDPGPTLCVICDAEVDEDSEEASVDDLGNRYCCDCCRQEAECEAHALAMEAYYAGDLIDGVGFADPGGRSALRAATPDNPRNLPCPNCGEPDRLTPADRARGYQCDSCADRAERGW